MRYVPCRYSGDLLGGGGGTFKIFELMEGYTPVRRHFPLRLVVPSLSVYRFYVIFAFFCCIVPNGSSEFGVVHSLLCLDWDPVHPHVFQKCCCRVRVFGELIKLVGASCLYLCLKETYTVCSIFESFS